MISLKTGNAITDSKKSKIVSPYYFKKDAASFLGISVRTMETLIADRKIEHIRIGRRLLFTSEQLQRFIQENTVKAR
jgi:excisionase family DNA binding protein